VPSGQPAGVAAQLLQWAAERESERRGTTHFSVADAAGNLVAFTTTIEANLGSAVVVPGRGFLLNNELTDFAGLPADPDTGLPFANRPEGGKRLRRTALGELPLSVPLCLAASQRRTCAL
jgi:gamma-glutamyltranspeptidase/glutathione hydrolase